MPTFKTSEETRHELKKFKEYMREQEYAEGSIICYHVYLSRFLRQTELSQKNTLKESIEAFLKSESTNHPGTFMDCRAALRLYYKMIEGGSLKNNTPSASTLEVEGLLQRFRQYSLEVKHIKKYTVDSEISHVRRFLEHAYLHNPEGFVNELMAEDVRKYVVEELDSLADSSKGRMITSIRNFFRCQAFYEQSVHPSIFRLPLSPAVWKKSSFPTTIDLSIFDTLHMIPDKNTATGKRDRSIILCFTELALRCSEVAVLSLDDFNWHGGYITIKNTKNGSERILPLPEMTGKALIEYITESRPHTSCRTIFVRFSRKSGEPMGWRQVRGVVQRTCAKAGLPDNECGTHILRRTAATKMYNSGNSLKLIADILGHASLDSTTHYTKTDEDMLLSVASSWPGGE